MASWFGFCLFVCIPNLQPELVHIQRVHIQFKLFWKQIKILQVSIALKESRIQRDYLDCNFKKFNLENQLEIRLQYFKVSSELQL